VERPAELRGTIERGLRAVAGGQLALVDIVLPAVNLAGAQSG